MDQDFIRDIANLIEIFINDNSLSALNFIKSFFDLFLINNEYLKYYFENLTILSGSGDVDLKVASYFPKSSSIEIYLDGLADFLNVKIADIANVTLNSFEEAIYIYICIIEILFHETEHVKQQYMMASEYSFESKLLRLSNALNIDDEWLVQRK